MKELSKIRQMDIAFWLLPFLADEDPATELREVKGKYKVQYDLFSTKDIPVHPGPHRWQGNIQAATKEVLDNIQRYLIQNKGWTSADK
jgi:hypothetical protein